MNRLFKFGFILLVLFLALSIAMKLVVAQKRFVSSKNLLEELRLAEFVEEPVHPASNWPQWRGPDRRGVTSLPTIQTDWSKMPPTTWKSRTGESYASFSIVNNRVFTMISSQDQQAVVCWDLTTGEDVWKTPYEPGRSFDYGGPRATPTCQGDRLYTVTPAGNVMCLEQKDGKVVWEVSLEKELEARSPRWGYATSPLVEDDLVFVMPGGGRGRSLAALRKSDGKTVWTSQDDPPGYSSPVAVTVDGVRQIVFFTGNRLLGVAPLDGSLLWEFPWNTRFEVNAATPVVFSTRGQERTNTYVFISSGYDRGCALVKIERNPQGDGFVARRVYESDQLCCHFSTAVRYKDHIYGLDEKRDLTCLNLRTGEVAWRFERGKEDDEQPLRQLGFKKGSLLRVDDRLLVLGEEGKLALVDATPEAYREITACRPFRDRCWTVPVLVDGKLLLRDRRQILCLDMLAK